MGNPNTNCLAGMRCPKCGSYGLFRIEVKTMTLFSDEGALDDGGDNEWDEASYCKCDECDHAATVAAFTES